MAISLKVQTNDSGSDGTSKRFRSKRPEATTLRYFGSWREDDDAPNTTTFASSYGRFRIDPDRPLLRSAALRIYSEDSDPGHAYPWVTFVLGSGCLAGETPSADDGSRDTSERVRRLVDAAFADAWFDRVDEVERDELRETIDRLGTRERVTDFIIESARNRIPGRVSQWLEETGRADEGSAEKRRFGVFAALGAALAARLYLETSSITKVTVDASAREAVEFDVRRFRELHRVDREVRQTLRALCELLAASPLTIESGVRTFLKVIERVATDSTIVRERIEVLGAFAWHFLTDGTSIYPGWSDVLLFQAADSNRTASQFLDVPMLRRPQVESLSDIAHADTEAWLVKRLRDITDLSWAEGRNRQESDREAFYESVADVLLQQATVNGDRAASAPLATAFISGFDVELEMALLRRIAAAPSRAHGTDIAVVVPVFHVRPADVNKGNDTNDEKDSKETYDTTLCWIWKRVNALGDQPLSDLLEGGGWVYNDSSRNGVLADQLRGLPVVVHLSGAPLIKVDGAQVRDLPGWGPRDHVRPALLLDENTSLIQVALDLKQLDGRLPADLADDAARVAGRLRCGPRYWAFVGVQLADPAVRLRLLSREISSAWGKYDERARDDERAREKGAISTADRGVVVNTWSPVSERQLFHWQGFGVVKAEARDITADVEALRDFIDREFLERTE